MSMDPDLEPLDPDFVAERLSKPPFVTISGVNNVRDLGSYPAVHAGYMTRPGILFRSAEISGITEDGKVQMRSLGIKIVYDLRSDTEIEKYGTPVPTIDGVEIVRNPVFKKEDYSPEHMTNLYKLYATATAEVFMKLYSRILDNAGPSFGIIFRHVRDRPADGCLFHCTAGKDRTGILAALFLKLAGVNDEAIAEDYALTRIGREPAREMVLARLAKEPLFASDDTAALKMLSSKAETMLDLLRLLNDKYGGIEEYLRQYIGLTDDDITTIRKNILVHQSSL